MDRLIKKIVLITAIIFLQENNFAQEKSSVKNIDNIINESIFVTTNSDDFLTGETLFYQLMCLNSNTNKASSYSKVAYLELIDSNKKTIIKQKLFLENATSNGDFFLPTTLETGNYKIIGYTNWMLNKDNPSYYVRDIKILNPYNQLDEKKITITQDSLKNDFSTLKNSEVIKIITNKKTYSNRELVVIDLKNHVKENLLERNFSLSVRKLNNIFNKAESNAIVSFNKNKSNANIPVFNNSNAIPELRGEIITGKIISKSGNKIADKNIALSIAGSNYVLKISKTNKNGIFSFIIDKYNVSQNLIIQLLDTDKDDFNIEIIEAKSPNYNALQFEKFEINANTKKFIEQKVIASQIENAFYEIKKDSIIPVATSDVFYKKSAKEYILDNYTRFPTLKETIIEVIEGMYIVSKNKNFSLYLRDFDLNNNLEIPPLIIVDGLLIQDTNDLLDHKAELFQKIEIIKGGYYFGTKLYNGLISFTTKASDYESKLAGSFIIKPKILRPLSKKHYYQPNYKLENNLTRIPDYREQLFWQTNFILNQNPISFYTSDISGKFEIILQGFTDTGIPVYESEIIEVK